MDFDWSSEQDRVHELRGTIDTNDEVEAAQLLARYVARRMRQLSAPTIPAWTVSHLEEHLRWRLAIAIEPISYLLTLHLFTEYWLNCCFETLLLRPHENLTYAEKLRDVCNSSHISDETGTNLTELNRLRNHAAHVLAADWNTVRASFQSNGPLAGGVTFDLLEQVVEVTYIPLVTELLAAGCEMTRP